MSLRPATSSSPAAAPATSATPSADNKFHNLISRPRTKTGFWAGLRLMWAFFNKPAGTVPEQPVPTQALTREALLAAPDRSLFRLGHSTVLLKLRGVFWLTDPVFAERASPVQWLGPKRFHAPPITLADLPEIEAVILSHDHYDHLDHETVRTLAPKVKHFLTPLGVGDRLIDWGIAADKVRQLNWWESTTVGGLQFTATPAQHFSGRTPFDGNRTLWASWVMIDDDLRVFFSGDTGYFPGFKTIGERFGPFDLTLMETGAYDPRWAYVHMLPEQTVQAHLDLRGRRLVPIHNGTFDLAFHAWQEPFERIAAAARAHAVEVLTPTIGAQLDMVQPAPTPAWWRASAEASPLAAVPSTAT
ncbi:MBL fold metallo-hydrolase [Ralstonia sp. ASV6]|uniref:MBL fold metallo-hydrolase n=1 Tax=Ralstonia sp. ASV6 TaxID=2795124 RepID=UPI0018EE2D65|nr:MBL fold metallo-hydrolase [Ralstonia sp. ASV6]